LLDSLLQEIIIMKVLLTGATDLLGRDVFKLFKTQ